MNRDLNNLKRIIKMKKKENKYMKLNCGTNISKNQNRQINESTLLERELRTENNIIISQLWKDRT